MTSLPQYVNFIQFHKPLYISRLSPVVSWTTNPNNASFSSFSQIFEEILRCDGNTFTSSNTLFHRHMQWNWQSTASQSITLRKDTTHTKSHTGIQHLYILIDNTWLLWSRFWQTPVPLQCIWRRLSAKQLRIYQMTFNQTISRAKT